VAGGVGVASHEDPLVVDGHAVVVGVLGGSPLEVKDVVLHEVPCFAQVLGDVEFLVNLAGLVLKLGATRPAGGQRPGALDRVEHELLDLLACVEGADISTAVFGNPVDSGST
jgi:hypothetical protein